MSKADAEKNSRMAAMMKAKGITRTTGRCPICTHMVRIPMDSHLTTTCKGPGPRR